MRDGACVAATAAAIGSTFEHAGSCYRRVIRKSYTKKGQRPGPADVLVDNTDTGERIELLRSEELLEITHLALVSYRVPDTGEVVPLLQIVPSKRNEERLLLVSPELASVLATIIGRLRHRSNGTVPLVTRYDEYECVTGPALPHLFQRKHGWRDQVIGRNTVMDLLNATLARTGLRDAARHPLRYTPHDFRRIFATDAVTGGLPVHIVAKLLGHQSLTTTEAYTAIFQDHLIRTYRAFLDRRRSIRPEAEYREPTADEWREFNQHFAMRKVELGTCGRPYGSPCKHEHACIRCSMLRVDPTQRTRLIEIIRSLTDRIVEAKLNGWLGEVEGLNVSLEAARTKLVSLERTSRSGGSITQLGIPVIRNE